MAARFHVDMACVNMVDVNPGFRGAAHQENIEFTLLGHLIQGNVVPGMLVSIRPHLRRGKYYRVRSIDEVKPPGLPNATNMPETVREELLSSGIFTTTTYFLHFICADRAEFEELVALNIQDEDIEILDAL